MAIKWITHKGRQILYVDYQECETEAALIALLEESARMIVSQPGKVRLICNFKGTLIGPGYMDRVKIVAKDISRIKLEKGAIIGFGGLTSLLVDGYIRAQGDKNLKTLETMEEARAWLASVG